MGKKIIIVGLIISFIGAVIWIFGDKLAWFGNLPGDIKIEKENFKLYFPITSMILASIVLSFLLWVFRKIF